MTTHGREALELCPVTSARRLLLRAASRHPNFDANILENRLALLRNVPEQIVAHEGLTLLHASALAGRAIGVIHLEHGLIQVLGELPQGRRRFTIAHELGHAVLHSGRGQILYRDSDGIENKPKPQVEIEADQFATELLMPRKTFVEFWRKHLPSLRHKYPMAWRPAMLDLVEAAFLVSRTAAEIRVRELRL